MGATINFCPNFCGDPIKESQEIKKEISLNNIPIPKNENEISKNKKLIIYEEKVLQLNYLSNNNEKIRNKQFFNIKKGLDLEEKEKNLNKEKAGFKNEIRQFEKDKEDFRLRELELNNKIKNIEENEKKINEEKERLKREKTKIEILKNKNEQKEKELNDMIEQNKQEKIINSQQNIENQKQKEKNEKYLTEKEAYFNQLEIDLRKRENSIENRENDLNKKNKELNEKTKQINILENHLKEQENQVNKKKKDLEILNNQNIEKEKKLKEQEEINKKQKEENEKKKEENEKQKKEYEKYKLEKDIYLNQLEIKNKELKKLIEENEKMYNKRLKESTEKGEEINIKENQLKEKAEQLIRANKEIELLNIQYQEKDIKLKESIEKNERQKTEIEKHKEENEKLKKEKESYLNKLELKKSLDKQEKELKEKLRESNKKEQELNIKESQIKEEEKQILRKAKDLEIKIKKNGTDYEQKKDYLLNWEKSLAKKADELKKMNISNIPILVGLNNIGATCYMNATLQCLSNSKKLTEYFFKFYESSSNKKMSQEYYKLLLNLWKKENNNKSYSPYTFKEVLSKENPLFEGIAANDSKDLINFLLERFHQELNKENPNNNSNMISQEDQSNEQLMLKLFLQEFQKKFNSPISNFFYGVLETKSQCLGCNIIKFNFQVYSFLEFPLQQVNQYFYSMGKKPLFTNDGKNSDVELYECFEYYRKVDLMTGDNQMYCNICNKLLNSYYSTVIYSSPIYLIINLNRGKGATYQCKVNFPEQLNLFNFVTYKNGYTAYGLYAVICHLGPSSMSGHFVAYCRNRIDNKWYLYNDAIVSPCTKPQQYNDGMPYILFYKALTLD